MRKHTIHSDLGRSIPGFPHPAYQTQAQEKKCKPIDTSYQKHTEKGTICRPEGNTRPRKGEKEDGANAGFSHLPKTKKIATRRLPAGQPPPPPHLHLRHQQQIGRKASPCIARTHARATKSFSSLDKRSGYSRSVPRTSIGPSRDLIVAAIPIQSTRASTSTESSPEQPGA